MKEGYIYANGNAWLYKWIAKENDLGQCLNRISKGINLKNSKETRTNGLVSLYCPDCNKIILEVEDDKLRGFIAK